MYFFLLFLYVCFFFFNVRAVNSSVQVVRFVVSPSRKFKALARRFFAMIVRCFGNNERKTNSTIVPLRLRAPLLSTLPFIDHSMLIHR